ncbi:hypothetical protein GYMLUDRAFT_471114 [Collybiopsis luxurians FD-317 M1]|uniref:Uncharacterized protein n=1 Tax=Collybiopsis luxurians FD-317 M1 TaxID=944289 RepID=A0A0D0CJG3_9AGAR|nr:hypothetical protein GYMLUDRAFT_471114 [Collybiopsis luxurians FD-317 M1]
MHLLSLSVHLHSFFFDYPSLVSWFFLCVWCCRSFQCLFRSCASYFTDARSSSSILVLSLCIHPSALRWTTRKQLASVTCIDNCCTHHR